MPIEARRQLEAAEERCFSPEWTKKALEDGAWKPPRLPSSNLRADHVKHLLQQGIIRRSRGDPQQLQRLASGNCSFVVAEQKCDPEGNALYWRLRWILWCAAAAASDREALWGWRGDGNGVNLPLLHKIEPCTTGMTCVTLDLTAAFFQRLLPPHATAAFRFFAPDPDSTTNEYSIFEATRLPMGSVLSPLVLQTYTCAIAACGEHSLFSDLLQRGVTHEGNPELMTYVDNIRVRGSLERSILHTRRILYFSKRFCVTLKLENTLGLALDAVTHNIDFNRTRQQTFLGCVWDDHGGCVVAPKTRNKILAMLHADMPTLLDLESQIGTARWAAYVLRIPLAQYWRVLAAWRWALAALRRGAPSSAVVRFNPEVRQEQTRLLRQLLTRHVHSASPSPRVESAPDIACWTDASSRGWGMVAAGPGWSFSFGQSWRDCGNTDVLPRVARDFLRSGSCHINVLEALALIAGAELARRRRTSHGGNAIQFWCDSMVVVSVWVRGRSKSDDLSRLYWEFVTRNKDVKWQIAHVPGALNPADRPSRDV